MINNSVFARLQPRSVKKHFIYVFIFCLLLPATSRAAVITFDFTGRLVVAGPLDDIIYNNGSTYTNISASLTYDTNTGLGGSGLTITMDDPFWTSPVTFHDISMARLGTTNFVDGQVLVDWSGNYDMPMHVEWDATGLFNAIDFGLEVGDVLSGSDLYHDSNGNGVQDAGEFMTDISSATPYSDSLQPDPSSMQGPAPLAATSGSLGMDESTPFSGIRGYLDIGSGNSMHVTSVSAVPVPAALWLFGSGLIGLLALVRKSK